MNFKQTIASDNDAVFLCFEEFGEDAVVNGKTTVVIVDDHELEKRNLAKSSIASSVDGISNSEVLFHINSNHFEHMPQTGKRMGFNSKTYLIDSVSEQLGMLTITLSRYSG